MHSSVYLIDLVGKTNNIHRAWAELDILSTGEATEGASFTLAILQLYTSNGMHQLYASCTPVILQLYSSYKPVIHQLYASYTPVIRQLYTSYTTVIQQLYTSYTPVIRQLYTSYTPVMHQL